MYCKISSDDKRTNSIIQQNETILLVLNEILLECKILYINITKNSLPLDITFIIRINNSVVHILFGLYEYYI